MKAAMRTTAAPIRCCTRFTSTMHPPLPQSPALAPTAPLLRPAPAPPCSAAPAPAPATGAASHPPCAPPPPPRARPAPSPPPPRHPPAPPPLHDPTACRHHRRKQLLVPRQRFTRCTLRRGGSSGAAGYRHPADALAWRHRRRALSARRLHGLQRRHRQCCIGGRCWRLRCRLVRPQQPCAHPSPVR